MTSQSALVGGSTPSKPAQSILVLLTPKEAARLLKLSTSWLAKSRMRGDGADMAGGGPVGQDQGPTSGLSIRWAGYIGLPVEIASA
jgi:hypothetical protein